MKRVVISIFLLLYVYNFVGYLAVFSFMQYRVKNEIKSTLKANVPQSDLIVLPFHTASLERKLCPIQWLDGDEFRYDGEMFDIVCSYVSGDTTYFLCINDVQEEILLVDLNDHVQRHMGNSKEQTELDSFKDVFKESNIHLAQYSYQPPVTGLFSDLPLRYCISITRDVPFPPPRLGSAG